MGEGGIDVQVAPIGGALEDALDGILEDRAILFLRVAQLALLALERADVLQGRAHAADVAIRVGDQAMAHEHRNLRPVLVAEGALGGFEPQFRGELDRDIVLLRIFDNEIPDRAAHHLFGRVTEHREFGGVDAGEAIFGIEFVVGDGGVVEEVAELRLRSPSRRARRAFAS